MDSLRLYNNTKMMFRGDEQNHNCFTLTVTIYKYYYPTGQNH